MLRNDEASKAKASICGTITNVTRDLIKFIDKKL